MTVLCVGPFLVSFNYLSLKRDTVKIACSVTDVTTSWWHRHGCPVHTDNGLSPCGWSACTLMSPLALSKDRNEIMRTVELATCPVTLACRHQSKLRAQSNRSQLGLTDCRVQGGHAGHRVSIDKSVISVPGCMPFSELFHP